jgi:hypothetical protein
VSDKRQGESGPPEGTGYETPGSEKLLRSTSPAVSAPSQTSEDRLTTPKPEIESIGERPADANPALVETVGLEQGQTSTADLLRARETAEEAHLRSAQAHIYEDQGPETMPEDVREADTGQPDYPYAHQDHATAETIESPDTQQDFMAATGGIGSMDLRARADSMVERAGNETVYNASMHGAGPVGREAEKLDYDGPEMPNTVEPSEIDMIAPDMKNIPSEDTND